MKKEFSGAKETHPDILHGGHRNSYQLENAIKKWWDSFLLISIGQGAVKGKLVAFHFLKVKNSKLKKWGLLNKLT